MKSFCTYKPTAEQAGLTVEAYLKQVLQFSGRKLQRLTRQKGILLNGRPAYLQKKLRPQDTLKVLVQEDAAYGVLPEPGSVAILYEDDALLVLNKPAGQLVHPAGQTGGGTLANFLAGHLRQQGIISAIRPVHRLDRDTSGCVLFAKNAHSQRLLEQQLAAGSLNRVYWALVQGKAVPPARTIDAPIGPHPRLPNRRSIDSRGEPATTHYRTLRQFPEAALLELTLDTGRTHQIRVHLAHLGYPIIGDGMYGARSTAIARQALHAAFLTFRHLEEDREVTVQAPLPADFSRAVDALSGSRAEGLP